MSHEPAPFRWDVTRRSQLGSLAQADDAALAARVMQDLVRLGGVAQVAADHPDGAYTWLTQELATTAAATLDRCGDADLVFVGRSPESLFDYMSGLLSATSWADRLTLLQLSLRSSTSFAQAMSDQTRREALERHLAAAQLSPQVLLARERPAALLDIIATGATMGHLVRFLKRWSDDERADWQQVRAKLCIVGLTARTKTSPKTWRWQQHVDWAALLPPRAIRNVSIAPVLFHYLGEAQPKTTTSFHQGRWLDPTVVQPRRDSDAIAALQLAVALYERGRTQEQRRSVARLMAELPAMRSRWYRALLSQL